MGGGWVEEWVVRLVSGSDDGEHQNAQNEEGEAKVATGPEGAPAQLLRPQV